MACNSVAALDSCKGCTWEPHIDTCIKSGRLKAGRGGSGVLCGRGVEGNKHLIYGVGIASSSPSLLRFTRHSFYSKHLRGSATPV